jgi:hypothetical protein
MASSGGFRPSPLPPIAETGMKGFFKWYAREQPGDYPRVAKAAWKNAPELFSDYTQSRATVIRHQAGLASLTSRTYNPSLQGLGQGGGQASDLSSQIQVLTESDLTPVNVALDDSTLNMVAPSNITTSDAANAGAGTSTTSTNWLSSLINSASNLIFTRQQVQTAQAITNLQLQRAQQGLSPLNIGMGANGIPIIGGAALGGTTGIVIALGALAALFFFSRGGSRRAA